jgi:transposase
MLWRTVEEMVDLSQVKTRFRSLQKHLDERTRRLFAAAESEAIGRGGISAVSAATGISRRVIRQGKKELHARVVKLEGRLRRPGGGRKRTAAEDPSLLVDLERLLEPVTRGDPESPLRWTCKSVRKLAEELERQGHSTSYRSVARLLDGLGYSLQANRKTREGSSHPDRNAQFEYLYTKVRRFQRAGQPVISVDTKKKEQVGDYKNPGREWRPKGNPEEVQMHDFAKKHARPYGVYDQTRNEGWVSVGVDHDTAAFAVESIRRWWRWMGRKAYPAAEQLLITADAGGSNGVRIRLWKVELQKLADETGLRITVCHFPPGTSKWNKIEHRLFSYISQNWRGQPLLSHEVVVNLIANTKTKQGLKVRAKLDTNQYPSGVKVTDEELAAVLLTPEKFHGEWNYNIVPNAS